MDWKEISAEEAEKHPAYGFGGGLYVVYAIVILWSLHSLYIVFLDSGYKLTQSYGYENFTMADFTCFIQFILALPFSISRQNCTRRCRVWLCRYFR